MRKCRQNFFRQNISALNAFILQNFVVQKINCLAFVNSKQRRIFFLKIRRFCRTEPHKICKLFKCHRRIYFSFRVSNFCSKLIKIKTAANSPHSFSRDCLAIFFFFNQDKFPVSAVRLVQLQNCVRRRPVPCKCVKDY